MLITSFELVHALHGMHNESTHRKRLSVTHQAFVFGVTALLLALVLYVGAFDHRSDDRTGDSVPERLRQVNPKLRSILVCLGTFLTMSEYTFCNLVYILLRGRVHHMIMTFAMMFVSILSNVTIEVFIIQTIGSNANLYWSKNVGICMAIYLRDAVSDLQKWRSSKQD